MLIEEKDLTADSLISEVMKLRNNPDMLKKMSKASRECAPTAATERIYTEIKEDE